MSTLKLQELADMDGAGNAMAALKEAGHWDEYAGQPEREYRVVVERWVKQKQAVTVTATNPKTAKSKAISETAHLFDNADIEVLKVE